MAKRIIKLTENDIKRAIVEAIKEVNNEGIDVDGRRNVMMTDKHEKVVDTSVDNNPTAITTLIPNVKVWSVFKRKQGSQNDGNPLLYALKGEKGYKLKNEQKVKSRIEVIVRKFISENNGIDVTIMVPSTNNLNMYFANLVARYCKNPQYIGDLFSKLTVEEVDDEIFEDGSMFRKHYGKNYEKAHDKFLERCQLMKDGYFRFHLINDIEMRKVIEKTIKVSDGFWGEYVEALNDKNILIVDDSITLGRTITEACRLISTYFTPKSITVLTLCSPLYDESGEKLANL